MDGLICPQTTNRQIDRSREMVTERDDGSDWRIDGKRMHAWEQMAKDDK